MATKRCRQIQAPQEGVARLYVKAILPGSCARRKKDVNGIWEIFSHKKAQLPLTYGFSLLNAWQEAAVLLGWTA